MIAIVDYGCGNLFSISSSAKALGLDVVVTGDAEKIKNADRIILPGVGAFEDAINKLRSSGLADVIIEEAKNGKPILGICLGMQLLFDKSYEYGEFEGLGLIKGEICPFEGDIDKSLKIPHMGWNKLIFKANNPIFKYISDGDYMYFVHSYYGKNCEESLLAVSEYDVLVPAVVNSKNVYGMQFHPEKSGEKGLLLLKAFSEI
ncbi:MAG: imidazole glycerol phosphate synthase subunit HisH [Ruminococcaceae bacterium]|nr:imidazole glycerol phosphate synthase subunit HisH [Oscillospiraceae bacterium]